MYFDGRRDERTYLNDCLASGGVAFGPNTQFEGSGWVVHHVESHRAVCGSAMVILASDFEVHDCIIQVRVPTGLVRSDHLCNSVRSLLGSDPLCVL